MSVTKRRELTVYKRVGLRWDNKSRAARRRIEDEGIFRFVGEGTSRRPWLKVLKSEYQRTWHQVAAAMQDSARARKLPAAEADNLLRLARERKVYDDLVAHARDLGQIEQQFERTHGRAMTPHELERMLGTMQANPAPSSPSSPADRAAQFRRIRIGRILKGVHRHQFSHVNQLQEIWARIAGSEAAMETVLESVNRQSGTAYFRAQSSVSGHRLRTQPGLREALSRELGCEIKRLVCR